MLADRSKAAVWDTHTPTTELNPMLLICASLKLRLIDATVRYQALWNPRKRLVLELSTWIIMTIGLPVFFGVGRHQTKPGRPSNSGWTANPCSIMLPYWRPRVKISTSNAGCLLIIFNIES